MSVDFARVVKLMGSLLIVLLVVGILGAIAIRWIPWFNIDIIEIALDHAGMKVPNGILRISGPLKGVNSFSVKKGEIAKEMSNLPMVDHVVVDRILPDKIRMNIFLYIPSVVVAVQQIQGQGQGVQGWIIKDGNLVALPEDEVSYYGKMVPVVFVEKEYALILQRYGIDEGFKRVMVLMDALSASDDTHHALITSIKYDNNNSRGFGRLVMEIPSCSAQLWVREPVSGRRIMDALAVIVQNYAADELNFLESGTLRYDLYSDALVKRSAGV